MKITLKELKKLIAEAVEVESNEKMNRDFAYIATRSGASTYNIEEMLRDMGYNGFSDAVVEAIASAADLYHERYDNDDMSQHEYQTGFDSLIDDAVWQYIADSEDRFDSDQPMPENPNKTNWWENAKNQKFDHEPAVEDTGKKSWWDR